MNDVNISRTPEHIVEWGDYNDSLPNLTELTAEEFSQSGFFTWCITGIEFRQIKPELFNKGNIFTAVKCYTSAKIFYVGSPNENGFVMISDYWEKKVRYFRFTKCEHDYEEVTGKNGKPVWNCYHYYKCRKCGQQNEVDSSD